MPWGMVSTQPDFWIGLVVGFGVMAVIMLVGFYMLLKSIGELKTGISRLENRIENIEKRVDDVARQLEEI
jgi:hypothetical protein